MTRTRYNLIPAIAVSALMLLCLSGRTSAQTEKKEAPDSQAKDDFVVPKDGKPGSAMTLDQLQARLSGARAKSEEIRVIHVAPAEEPAPALRHRFWIPAYQRKPGSALLHFSRAMILWHQIPPERRAEVERYSGGDPMPTEQELQGAVE